MTDDDLLSALERRRVLAIVRADDAANAVRASLALVEAGVGLLEISLTTPGAARAIGEVAREIGDAASVGAGTVLTPDDVRRVADAGAGFVVTPAVTDAVASAVAEGLPVLAGALTPTEIVAARSAGAAAIKLFPAGSTGVETVAALLGPFPDLPIVPVGGVGHDDVAAYARAGALAVGVGSPLLGDAGGGGDLSALADRARRFLEAAEAWS